VRAALSVIDLLPTPTQRTTALLAILRTEVTRRSGKETPAPESPGRLSVS